MRGDSQESFYEERRSPTPVVVSTSEPLPSVVTTLVAGAISLTLHVSFLISQTLGTAYHPVDIRIRFGIAVIVATASGLLWVRRRTASDALCDFIFFCIVAPFALTFWITEVSHAESGRYEQPFVGPKLMLFVVSALCPTRPRWLAPLLLAFFTGEMAAIWVYIDYGSIPVVLATGEPWISLSYMLLACFLFGSRLHWMRLHEELAVARAEATILQTTNDAFVAVQDLANTPLQSLEIALTLMHRGRPNDPLIRSAERAVRRLRALTRHLPVESTIHPRVDATALEGLHALRDSTTAEHESNGTAGTAHGGAPRSWAARLSQSLRHHARHLLFRRNHPASP